MGDLAGLTSIVRQRAWRLLFGARAFRSDAYWEQRYREGGTSGAGSYGRLATYKAEFLNAFVAENQIGRVLELGCGDGNQLSLAEYAEYVGFDIAPAAVELCRKRFTGRPWRFYPYSRENVARIGAAFRPDLIISLDVIFHLVERPVFEDYMAALFSLEPRFVVIYSSNGRFGQQAGHIRNWKFTDWIDRHRPDWRLVRREDNPYVWDPALPDDTSFSDFYVFAQSTTRAPS